MFGFLQQQLLALSDKLPVEWFVFIGAFVEEIIAPIPSPIVMMTAGVLLETQSYSYNFMLWVALIGSVSKLFGTIVLYYFGLKFEHLIVGKFGPFFGISENDVVNFGKHFRGGLRDYLYVALARAIPIVPSAPVSILSGIFKIDFKAFCVGTFLGTWIRNLIYLYIGFTGIDTYKKWSEGFASTENYIQFVIAGVIVLFILWWKLLRGSSGKKIS